LFTCLSFSLISFSADKAVTDFTSSVSVVSLVETVDEDPPGSDSTRLCLLLLLLLL
jgi:hypothetical protein